MNHTFGIFLTIGVHVVVGILALTIAESVSSSEEDDGKNLDEEMMMINASLAKKKEVESEQPQKEFYEPTEARTPDAITDDPEAKKRKKKKKKDEDEPEIDWEAQVGEHMADRKKNDRDLDHGEAAKSTEGQWDGHKKGWAKENTGHKYWRELAGDAYSAWSVPTLETGEFEVLGCVRLMPSGKIVDTRIWKPTKNSTFDRSVNLVLKKLEKERTGKADQKVPDELLPEINVWRCMKFRKEAG
jgi:hypothetical protein